MQVYRPSRQQPAGIQLGQLPACSWENEKGEENVSGRNVTGSKENDSEAFNTNIRTYAQVQMDTERRTYRYQRLISTILEVKSQLSSLILIVIVMKITHSLDQNQSTDGLFTCFCLGLSCTMEASVRTVLLPGRFGADGYQEL